jgi:hypothetical protein
MQMEGPTSTNKNHLPFVTEWHIKLHKMLSSINASRKLFCSAMPPEDGRPGKCAG